MTILYNSSPVVSCLPCIIIPSCTRLCIHFLSFSSIDMNLFSLAIKSCISWQVRVSYLAREQNDRQSSLLTQGKIDWNQVEEIKRCGLLSTRWTRRDIQTVPNFETESEDISLIMNDCSQTADTSMTSSMSAVGSKWCSKGYSNSISLQKKSLADWQDNKMVVESI